MQPLDELLDVLFGFALRRRFRIFETSPNVLSSVAVNCGLADQLSVRLASGGLGGKLR
jgi:hypothetical protein